MAALCCLVLLAAYVPVQTGAVAGVSESFRIDSARAGPEKPFEAFDAVTIAAFDLDGDGVKEIIAHNDNNRVYVFNGADGALVAELETRHPAGWQVRELAGISVGDVDGDGNIDLVVTNSAGWVTAFETASGGFQVLWERFMDPHEEDPDYSDKPGVHWNGHPGLDGSAYLADATGDGRDEVFLQLDDTPGMYALTGDGEVYGWAHWSEGNSNPLATDLTGDGAIEAVYPSDGGLIAIFDGGGFNTRCVFNARDHGAWPASISVAPTAVDLTGDGSKEIVFGVRNAEEDEDDAEWYLKQNAHYFALTADCGVLWQRTWGWSNPHVHMHPVPADVDGDGALDVVFMDWNTVGHKPGAWQVTGRPNLFAVDGATGDLIWRVETGGYWSNKNVALADVTGDGEEELLVLDERGGREGVSLYSLRGEHLDFFTTPAGWVVSRGPSVVDMDGDGGLEIVVPIMRGSHHCTRDLDVGCREGALQVYDTAGGGEPTWPNLKTYNDRYDDQGIEPGARVRVELGGSDDDRDDDVDNGLPEGNETAANHTGDNETTADGAAENDTATGDSAQNDTATDDSAQNDTATDGAASLEAQPDYGGGDDGGGGGTRDEGGGDARDDGGGDARDEGVEPPVIAFTSSPEHGPMDPISVGVTASSPVRDVQMRLGDLLLDVELDGSNATHTPVDPLPVGNHDLTVTATDASGASATETFRLSIQENDTLEPEGPLEEPQAPQEPPPRDPEDPGDRYTPLGPAIVLLAIVGIGLVIAYRRPR